MAEEKKPEEKSKDEKPKYDDKIKSTKDVIDDKLKDKKVEYGSDQYFSKEIEELQVEIPKRTNDLTIEINAQIYACLKKYKDKGVYNVEEVGKTAEEVYNTASNVILKTIGFDGFKPKNKDGDVELEGIIKSYVGNLDKKAFKKALEEEYTQLGYLNEKNEFLQKNMLNYPVGTFFRKRQQRASDDLEEKMSTIEGFNKAKERVEFLAKKHDKPLTEEDKVLPNRVINKLVELEAIDRKK